MDPAQAASQAVDLADYRDRGARQKPPGAVLELSDYRIALARLREAWIINLFPRDGLAVRVLMLEAGARELAQTILDPPPELRPQLPPQLEQEGAA